MKKLYQDGETAIYYLMVGNDDYVMPAMPEGCEEGIIKGMYKFRTVEAETLVIVYNCLVAVRS